MDEIGEHRLHRLIFFSDAVLAILITLLLVDLKLPELIEKNSAREMYEKVLLLLPSFASFLVCFLTISQAWLGYNILFSLIKIYNNTIGVLAFIALIPTCFFPFADSLISEYFSNPFGFVFLGIISGLTSFSHFILYNYLLKNNLISEKVDKKRIKRFVKISALFPFISLACGFAAFISPLLSLMMFSLPIILVNCQHKVYQT